MKLLHHVFLIERSVLTDMIQPSPLRCRLWKLKRAV